MRYTVMFFSVFFILEKSDKDCLVHGWVHIKAPLKTLQIIEESDGLVCGYSADHLGFNQHVVLKKISE
jgi:hypothetical protein